MREIHGLLWTERCRPRKLPPVKTPAQKAGLSYQKKVGGALTTTAKYLGASLLSEPWFRFCDADGVGQAVPDFILSFGVETLIIEVKLTYTPEAGEKLTKLYLPIVMDHYQTLHARSLVICKNLTPDASHLVNSLSIKKGRGVPVLHWLGRGPITWA